MTIYTVERKGEASGIIKYMDNFSDDFKQHDKLAKNHRFVTG